MTGNKGQAGANIEARFFSHTTPRPARCCGLLAYGKPPTTIPAGFIVTALLGIAGALLGGFIGRFAGFYGPGGAAGFIMSTLGAVALLFAYRKLRPA